MEIYSFTASYDGKLVSLRGRPTQAGTTDMGLLAHSIDMRMQWTDRGYGEIWHPVWDLTVDALDRFSMDSRKLARQREQFPLDLGLVLPPSQRHPRRLR